MNATPAIPVDIGLVIVTISAFCLPYTGPGRTRGGWLAGDLVGLGSKADVGEWVGGGVFFGYGDGMIVVRGWGAWSREEPGTMNAEARLGGGAESAERVLVMLSVCLSVGKRRCAGRDEEDRGSGPVVD